MAVNYGLNKARFTAWFDRACPGAVTGSLRARLLVGGRSNLTYEVSDGTRSWVVRRPLVLKTELKRQRARPRDL